MSKFSGWGGLLLTTVLLFSKEAAGQSTKTWSYNGQNTWSTIAPACTDSGARQSPLQLRTADDRLAALLTETVDFPPLKLGTGWSGATEWKLVNNENFLTWTPAGSFVPTLSGGPFTGDYAMVGIDFHIGDGEGTGLNHFGAEHTIDNVRAHAEIQFIFRNSKYASDAVASEAGDGYAGLAFLLRVPEASEPPVHHTMGVKKLRTAAVRYVDAVERLNGTIDPSTGEKREPTIVSKIHLGDFLHGVKDVRNYLSYDGSFTSPERGCKEAIVWAVFADPLPIEEEVLIPLRKPEDDDGNSLKRNWRDSIFSTTRKNKINEGLAGFPQWEAPAGGNQDKVPRRERFFLLKLQELSKELGEAARAVRTLKSEKVKLDAAASAAVSQAALLAGTEGEADANAAVTAANAAVAAKQVEIDAAETEEATKQAAVDEQRDLIGQLVMFRYAQG